MVTYIANNVVPQYCPLRCLMSRIIYRDVLYKKKNCHKSYYNTAMSTQLRKKIACRPTHFRKKLACRGLLWSTIYAIFLFLLVTKGRRVLAQYSKHFRLGFYRQLAYIYRHITLNPSDKSCLILISYIEALKAAASFSNPRAGAGVRWIWS